MIDVNNSHLIKCGSFHVSSFFDHVGDGYRLGGYQ